MEIDDLKNIPCILVASLDQQETEKNYYQEIVGIKGDFLFAENLEEARLLAAGGKGFVPIDGVGNDPGFAPALSRIRLTRKEKSIKRKYCAFWKVENSGYYIENFADILKAKFKVTI